MQKLITLCCALFGFVAFSFAAPRMISETGKISEIKTGQVFSLSAESVHRVEIHCPQALVRLAAGASFTPCNLASIKGPALVNTANETYCLSETGERAEDCTTLQAPLLPGEILDLPLPSPPSSEQIETLVVDSEGPESQQSACLDGQSGEAGSIEGQESEDFSSRETTIEVKVRFE